jgi:hypothetical protein
LQKCGAQAVALWNDCDCAALTIMPQSKAPKILFAAVEIAISGFWVVMITLPDDAERLISDFRTRQDAEAWIANESPVWLSEYKGGRYA